MTFNPRGGGTVLRMHVPQHESHVRSAPSVFDYDADTALTGAIEDNVARLTGANARTFTAPDIAHVGMSWIAANGATADLTIDGHGADTINGAASLALAPGQAVRLIALTATSWRSVGAAGDFVKRSDLKPKSTDRWADYYSHESWSESDVRGGISLYTGAPGNATFVQLANAQDCSGVTRVRMSASLYEANDWFNAAAPNSVAIAQPGVADTIILHPDGPYDPSKHLSLDPSAVVAVGAGNAKFYELTVTTTQVGGNFDSGPNGWLRVTDEVPSDLVIPGNQVSIDGSFLGRLAALASWGKQVAAGLTAFLGVAGSARDAFMAALTGLLKATFVRRTDLAGHESDRFASSGDWLPDATDRRGIFGFTTDAQGSAPSVANSVDLATITADGDYTVWWSDQLRDNSDADVWSLAPASGAADFPAGHVLYLTGESPRKASPRLKVTTLEAPSSVGAGNGKVWYARASVDHSGAGSVANFDGWYQLAEEEPSDLAIDIAVSDVAGAARTDLSNLDLSGLAPHGDPVSDETEIPVIAGDDFEHLSLAHFRRHLGSGVDFPGYQYKGNTGANFSSATPDGQVAAFGGASRQFALTLKVADAPDFGARDDAGNLFEVYKDEDNFIFGVISVVAQGAGLQAGVTWVTLTAIYTRGAVAANDAATLRLYGTAEDVKLPFIDGTAGVNQASGSTAVPMRYDAGTPMILKFTSANTADLSLDVNQQGSKHVLWRGGARVGAANPVAPGALYPALYDGAAIRLLADDLHDLADQIESKIPSLEQPADYGAYAFESDSSDVAAGEIHWSGSEVTMRAKAGDVDGWKVRLKRQTEVRVVKDSDNYATFAVLQPAFDGSDEWTISTVAAVSVTGAIADGDSVTIEIEPPLPKVRRWVNGDVGTNPEAIAQNLDDDDVVSIWFEYSEPDQSATGARQVANRFADFDSDDRVVMYIQGNNEAAILSKSGSTLNCKRGAGLSTLSTVVLAERKDIETIALT